MVIQSTWLIVFNFRIQRLALLPCQESMIKYKNSCCVLGSSNKHLHDEPVAKLKTYGDRAYSVAAQKLWNKSAESDIRLSSSLTVFKTIKSYGTDN